MVLSGAVRVSWEACPARLAEAVFVRRVPVCRVVSAAEAAASVPVVSTVAAASRSGLAEKLQQQGILLAGPTTVTALLNALAMGFRTLAINRKATEVWQVLGAAKMQYEKFGDLLQKARKKVDEAGKVLDEADHRNDIIQKHLRRVETLDDPTAAEAVPELFD